MKRIKVEGISKSFGDAVAVDDISFEVQEGEMVTLLGPSGCGKTTTLRMIAGLERADGGEIWVGDRLVSAPEKNIFIRPEKRGMGMVFQSYALWPHMTVSENVAFPLKRRGIASKEIQQRVDAILETVGMGGYQKRPAPLLSGGQAQRVALARALVLNPDVLLLDEPLSNLDARLREEMRFELRELQARIGVTAILVTHDQAEAMAMSDRTIVMSAGRIEQIGTPSDVYESPASPYVMNFFGQVNSLPARASQKADGTWVARIVGAEENVVALDDRHRWEEDQEFVVSFRAQDVSLRPANGGSAWTGVVHAAAYLGTHIEYVVRMGDNDVRVIGPCRGRLAQGDRASCDIDDRSIHAWPVG